ncbi:hypothetical protein CEXT_440841 [Caerostris extrusa]|uniref:Transposase n=1 Tax=Caerostris extrusa TaxID=172846 RepID=A0AAV4R0C5_CAEEX|nr:hypothetical protein CEXT_440841 [Caerostris extrusa]
MERIDQISINFKNFFEAWMTVIPENATTTARKCASSMCVRVTLNQATRRCHTCKGHAASGNSSHQPGNETT